MPKIIRNGLTARRIATAEPGFHADGGGLYLQVSHNTNGRSWIFRYTVRGRTRHMGLGSTQSVSLSDARDLAYQARRTIAVDLTDPLDLRRVRKGLPQWRRRI